MCNDMTLAFDINVFIIILGIIYVTDSNVLTWIVCAAIALLW